MGNCLSDEGTAQKSAQSETNLQKMSYSDFQNTLPPETDGQAPSHRHQTPTPAASYLPTGHPGHGMHGHQRHLGHPTGGYYYSGGPFLLLNPYTGKNPTENGGPDTSSVVREVSETSAVVNNIPKTSESVKDKSKTSARTKEISRTSAADKAISKMSVDGPETSARTVVTSATKARERPASYRPSDVMISYSHSDTNVMQKIKDKLEAEGITVWVDVASIDPGADFLTKIGEAIIDAKVFVCILSEQAVQSRYCRDEVALAYVSNSAIFPVNVQPRDQVLPLMDTGLKLQLANYNWISLTNADAFDANITTLVSVVKAELADLRQFAAAARGPLSPEMMSAKAVRNTVTSVDDIMLETPNIDKEKPGPKMSLRERNRAVTSVGDEVSHVMPHKFWSDRFGASDYVIWERFTSAFFEEFREPVERTFSSEDQQQQLVDILKRELEVDEDCRVYQYQFMAFCSSHGETRPVWQCVYDQARESFAMREVFNMESSVRVEAIENLGKFRSAAVIDALRDLLRDPDANVRAVATVSLSRTDVNDPVTIRHILRMLSDKDRLVREAGCLAVGHLKVRQAVSQLTHLWRNDVISHVREAAAAALRQIGGQEVEEVMRVTKVLAEEIRTLTEMKS